MTILTFKEGRVQVLVGLQAPTFIGQEGTKIEMYIVHFDNKYDQLSIQINVKIGGMSL